MWGGLVTVTLDDLVNNLDVVGGLHSYLFTRRNWESVSPELNKPYYEDSTTKIEGSAFVKASWLIGEETSYPNILFQADVQARYVQMSFMPDARTAIGSTPIPDHNWFFVNARVGASIATGQHTNLYASVGRTGREPTRFDMLGGTQITPANVDVLLNPNTVRPEYVLDAELGLRDGLNLFSRDQPDLLLSVNVFSMWFTDEIAPVGEYIEQYFVQRRVNVATSRRWGLETEFSWHILDNLHLDASAAFMQGEISSVYLATLDTTVTDVKPILTPTAIAAASLHWNALPWLGFEAGTRSVSESFLELTNAPNLMLPAFRIYHAAMRVHVAPVRLVLMMNNLTDVQYATNGGVDYSSGSAVPSVFMQAGRNVWLMAELSL